MELAIDHFRDLSKNERYLQALQTIRALYADEPNITANLANTAAVLKDLFNFWWVGFYVAEGSELVLGPFQGPLACTRIPFGKGVCGTAALVQESIIVPDVEQFEGHIACSSASKSEIVIPIVIDEQTALILDIDSEKLNAFDLVDRHYLEELARELKIILKNNTI